MGIPKFFRYISERYPLTSQLIQENKIPEFDNLYVDFNGIIHNCSHPNDEDAHFRLSEEAIFTSIFTYVDHLFGKIKPKKLFFMAVDGVAPRAKMNQQRSRRFRTAKEAAEIKEKAERRGEKLPDEKAFDSNCITPGTPFMARLSAQLKYFVNKKISEDADWAGVEVVLSGHETPGEGEHKIMEYIRLAKAQPGYNANTRHCLYGLDADLMMLGLLSHDPHFCLLREEVKFGPAARKKTVSLQQQNFFLLHLCLLREYLDLEFKSVAPQLSFAYNLERIIDDFVLLAVFVGNDFLPHLPDLHIHENALERLFNIYKDVLPRAGGYINNGGVIDVGRLQLVLDELAKGEVEVFLKESGDGNWMKGKRRQQKVEPAPKKGGLQMSKRQAAIFKSVRKAVMAHRRGELKNIDTTPAVTFVNDLSAGDKKFLTTLANDLNLMLAWDEFNEHDQNIVSLYFPAPPNATRNGNGKAKADGSGEGGEGDGGDEGEWTDDTSDDEAAVQESNAAVDRVLNRYQHAKTLEDGEDEFDKREAARLKEKMDEWKKGYYKEKLEIEYNDTEAVNKVVYRWIEGLQWVMFYYYSGVASWGWFYDYHYSPRITDFKGVDKMTFNFELGTPFRPYQQLMGVLPEASKELIPLAYQDLMYSPDSPILDFYPKNFEADLNGKKQEWEAVVKIPFLDQNRLLKAMAERDHRLTPDERQRNGFGESTRFIYEATLDYSYPSSLPGFFPAISHCKCRNEAFHLPTLDGLHLVEGLCDGVFLGSSALAGFPSLATLPHTGRLEFHHVNVFQSDSRNQSVVIEIDNDAYEGKSAGEIAQKMVGKKTFLGWPFLQEGMVAAVSDDMFRHEMRPFGNAGQMKLASMPHSHTESANWKRAANRIEQVYSKRYAVVTGPVNLLLHVRPLKGLKRLDTGALVKDYEGRDKEVEQAVQLGLQEVVSEDPRFLEQAAPPMAEEFPEGSRIIFLGEHAYGVAAQVSATKEDSLTIVIAFFPGETSENESFTKIVRSRLPLRYYQSYDAANAIGISGLALSKITSSLMVLSTDGSKTNLGLSLKFDAKGLKVMDYSRKEGRSWEFSDKAVDLVREYRTKYPELFRALNDRSDDMLRAADIFQQGNPDAKVKEIKSWLASKGVRDFDPVPLGADQLKKDVVIEIERLADSLNANKSATSIKKAKVQGIPRQAVLKPAHAVYRLQTQKFALGDRVIMVQDSGSVPLAAKGVVVGLNADSIDVVWDVPFISGSTLGGRCTEYRGSTMTMNSCLNLTNRQYVTSTKPQAPPPPQTIAAPIVPRESAPGHRGNWRGRGGAQNSTPTIMTNPNRNPPNRGGIVLPSSAPKPIVARQDANSYGTTLRETPRERAPPPSLSQTENLMSALGLSTPAAPRQQAQPSQAPQQPQQRQLSPQPQQSQDARRQEAPNGNRGRGFQNNGPRGAPRGSFGGNRGRGGPPPQVLANGRGRGGPGRGRGRGRGVASAGGVPSAVDVAAQ